jgi:hypothetical protein
MTKNISDEELAKVSGAGERDRTTASRESASCRAAAAGGDDYRRSKKVSEILGIPLKSPDDGESE